MSWGVPHQGRRIEALRGRLVYGDMTGLRSDSRLDKR
jgi:hypothetical protein